VPDRIVLLPGGRIVFVELKRPKGGVLSTRQKWWAKKLIVLDFHHWVIWDFEELGLFCAVEL
jgi:ubiquinone/menaquinone biosynthesis C-methylase UbiE